MQRVLKMLIIGVMLVSVAGCAAMLGLSRKPVYPTPLNDEMKEAFSLAEQNYMSGNFSEAERLYQTYISSYGYNELADEARFKLGEIAFMGKNHEAALAYYREAFGNLYNPEIAPKAQFKAALSLYHLSRLDQALAVLDQMERRDLSAVLALRSDSLAIQIGDRLGRGRDGMIKWHLFLLDDYVLLSPREYEGKIAEKLADKDAAYQAVLSWARDANVSLEMVDALPLSDMKGKTSGGFVLYKLAMVHYARGDFDDAAKFMRKFLNGYPKHEFASEGSSLLAELKGKAGGKKYKIGVILPLSGRFALYGNSTLHGIQCAAGLTPPCTSPLTIELVVKDSAGDAAIAEQAVADLAKENVIAVIGPLLSSTVGSAARKAQDLKIPMVSLSQMEGVAEAGEFVFKHALTSQDQINTLVDYAVGGRRLKKFGILHPSNNYGTQFAQAFRSAVEAAGGKVVFEKGYAHQDLKASESVKEMGSYTSFGGAIVEGLSKKFSVPADVQALFIPDSYRAVRYVVLAVHNDSEKLLPNMLFMGVNRWNNPGLVSHDIGLLEGSVFVDGFYKDSADVTTRHFVQSFLNAFGMEPTILEAQAFDAMKIVMAGIRNGGSSCAKLGAAIRGLKNVGGVTGSITIGANGESRRRLFILTVKGGTIAELSSARGIIREADFSYSKDSRHKSDAKYDGAQPPDLTVRTDLPKYEPADFYNKEME